MSGSFKMPSRDADEQKISRFGDILRTHIHRSLTDFDIELIKSDFEKTIRRNWEDFRIHVRTNLEECLVKPDAFRIELFKKLNISSDGSVFDVEKYKNSNPSNRDTFMNEDCDKYFDAIFDNFYHHCAKVVLDNYIKVMKGEISTSQSIAECPRVDPPTQKTSTASSDATKTSEVTQSDPFFASEQDLMGSLSHLQPGRDWVRVSGSTEESGYSHKVTSERWRDHICTVSYREEPNASSRGGLEKSQRKYDVSLSEELIIRPDDLLTVEEKAENRSKIELCKLYFKDHRNCGIDVISEILEKTKRNKSKPSEQEAEYPTVSTALTSIQHFPAVFLQEKQIESERPREESASRVQPPKESEGIAPPSAAGTSTSTVISSTEKFFSPKKRLAAKHASSSLRQPTRDESVAGTTSTEQAVDPQASNSGSTPQPHSS